MLKFFYDIHRQAVDSLLKLLDSCKEAINDFIKDALLEQRVFAPFRGIGIYVVLSQQANAFKFLDRNNLIFAAT